MTEPGATSILRFRHLLTGVIDAFLQKQGVTSPGTAMLVAELAVILSRYREEGTALYPAVFVCERIETLTRHVDASDALLLGIGSVSVDTLRGAVKVCAPLAQSGWSIFLDRQGDALRFGVFRSDDFVLCETPLEILRHSDAPELQAVGVFRVSDDVIELRGGVGPSHYIYLSGARTDAPPPGVVSAELLSSLTRDSDPEVHDGLRTFYRRVLLDILFAVQGTLIAVVPPGVSPRGFFSDGIFLPDPVNVGGVIQAYQSHRGGRARAALDGLRALLRGMTASDGITVLRSDGAIIGFNVFLAHASAATTRHEGIPGGARRRAFDALVGLLDRGLVAAFYRSQDGYAECRQAAADP